MGFYRDGFWRIVYHNPLGGGVGGGWTGGGGSRDSMAVELVVDVHLEDKRHGWCTRERGESEREMGGQQTWKR